MPYTTNDIKSIEAKWQRFWDEQKTFRVQADPSRKKFYCLEMFPYPSGKIHMGHVRNYTIADVIARYKMMQGFNVMHPIGYDAFGQPAENAAIKNNTDPAEWTYHCIDQMHDELKAHGIYNPLSGDDFSKVAGIAYMRNGQVVRQGLSARNRNVDDIPLRGKTALQG